MGSASGGGVGKEADEGSPPQQTALEQATPATNVLTPVATATAPQTRTKKIKKSLAQYAHHDNKGAVGWVAPPSTNQPYPHRQHAQGQRVLAQYAHHDNKGAVRWVAPPSVNQPYPYREYVQGQRVLAQYGHHDNKWAVKHPVY